MVVTVKMLSNDWRAGQPLEAACQDARTPAADSPGEGKAHLWRVGLRAAAPLVARMESLLSSDERSRASSYRFADDRRRFIVARGSLRWLLGGYLRCGAREVRFSYGPQGKPFLDQGGRSGALSFNLSHSGEMAICAFARGREIGVDLERLDRSVEVGDLAEDCLSRGERAAIQGLRPELRRTGFLEMWTRKEALLKARGVGVTVPLASLDLRCAADHASMVSVPGDSERWWLCAFRPHPEYTAALAVRGGRLEMSCWEWSAASPDACASVAAI